VTPEERKEILEQTLVANANTAVDRAMDAVFALAPEARQAVLHRATQKVMDRFFGPSPAPKLPN
jgi:hypothetical protein